MRQLCVIGPLSNACDYVYHLQAKARLRRSSKHSSASTRRAASMQLPQNVGPAVRTLLVYPPGLQSVDDVSGSSFYFESHIFSCCFQTYRNLCRQVALLAGKVRAVRFHVRTLTLPRDWHDALLRLGGCSR